MATNHKKLSGFLGMNQRIPRSALRTEEGIFVAKAVNVDLTQGGIFVGRAGFSRAVAGSDMHSLWASASGRAFVASAGQLCTLDVQSGASAPVGLELASMARLAYCDLPGGDIAVSDGRSLHRIRADNSVAPLVPSAPSPEPLPLVEPGDKHYLYCFAHVDARGLVGLCTPVRRVVGERLSFEIPQPPSGHKTQVYVSHPNGEVMYLLAESDGGVVVAGEQRIGGPCPNLHMQHLLPGSDLQVHGARLYVVRGAAIYFSEPFQFGVMAPTNFLQLPAPVTVFAPMPGGCFVVADKTYWLLGTDPALAELAVVNQQTGVSRSLARLDDSRVVWGSSEGVVVGNGAGEVVSLTDGVIPSPSVLPGTTGATLPMERNGTKQIINKRLHPGFGRAGVTMEAQ